MEPKPCPTCSRLFRPKTGAQTVCPKCRRQRRAFIAALKQFEAAAQRARRERGVFVAAFNKVNTAADRYFRLLDIRKRSKRI
jgi:hypothetical protein